MVETWALGSQAGWVERAGNNNRFRAYTSGQTAGKKRRAARGLFFVLAFLILFSGLTVVRTFASSDHVQPETVSEVVVYADTGDTLWDLAAALKKESMDNRQAVHLLMERNNLNSSRIQSGQKLIVPSEMLP